MKLSKLYTLASLALIIVLGGCASSYYNAGTRFYNAFAYEKAVDKFKKALAKKDIPDAKRKLADSYRKLKNSAETEKWYKEVADMPDGKPLDRLYAAQAMMSNGNYSDAKVYLKQYLDQVPSDQMAQKLFASCDSIGKWRKDSARYIIEVPNLNGSASNMSPFFYKNGVMFSSDRSGSKKKYEWNGRPFLDIYFANETSPGNFDNPKQVNGINGIYHEGNAVVSPDGKTIYFTRNNYVKKKAKTSSTEEVVLKIYQATKNDTVWTDIKELSFNSDEFSCGHPALSADGKTMYFTSDMPGGFGGTDIYMATKDGDNWSAPKNLGSSINTSLNEQFPTLVGDAIYFSSEGHYNIGGLDIFKSTFNNGAWSQPVNLGFPFNSQSDDFGYITKDGGETGYLSSNRNSRDGKIDQILRFRKPDLIINLNVLVRDKVSGLPLAGAKVEFLNKRTGQKETKTTKSDGTVDFTANEETEYTLLASKEGYFKNSMEFSTVGFGDKDDLNQKVTIDLEKMKVNEPIVLKNIYYDFDKADIRPDAAIELDKLVKIMKDNPTIIVELGSHTDSRGTDQYNQKLSKRRADSAVKYIISKGITANRITAKGYGETRLLNNCKDGVKCSDDEHQLNRRTEFTVTGFTDQPVIKSIK
jgi:outer membrane protein OmpA-like peptidoglycan-associated protein/tetratricopeptide (TPR) repeat protein